MTIIRCGTCRARLPRTVAAGPLHRADCPGQPDTAHEQEAA